MTPNLTTANQASLKTAILADPALAILLPPQKANPSGDDFQFVADAMNAAASPVSVIWAQSVKLTDVFQNNASFDWTRVDNLTVGKSRIVEYMLAAGFLNPAMANVRAGVNAAFNAVADTATRQAIFNECVRNATRAEKVFASGGSGGATGTAPSDTGVGPAKALPWGALTAQEVSAIFSV